MSFCIRGIASGGGRYVPAIVAQGCGPRLLGTGAHRQPAGHIARQQHLATSAFLQEFLSSSAPTTPALYVGQDHSLYNVAVDLHTANAERIFDSYPAYDVRCESNTHQVTELNGSQPVSVEQVTRWNYLGHKTQVTSPGVSAKDETKVQFAAIPEKATVHKPETTNVSADNKTEDKKQSNDDLVHIYETLKLDFPTFFTKSIDYRIYHPEIEFVNNIKGTSTKGIYPYVKQMAFLRTVGHIKFAYVKMDVLKITMHTQDNTVKVRWRINGITGMKVLFNFWKFKFWKIRDSLKVAEVWHDGFSTFYVGKDGLVYKHVADKMMPDDNVDTEKPKAGIPTKLATPLTFSSLN